MLCFGNHHQLGISGQGFAWQELEDLLDDDQDMEDMYLARRRGEEAMLALHHMAYIAQNHAQQPQAHESQDPQHVGVMPAQAFCCKHNQE